MNDPVRDFLTSHGESLVVEAIRSAEKNTSGEVRVHIECGDGLLPPLVRAERVFYALGMEKTAQKNAVLLYIDVQYHTFALWAGQGIYEATPENFWDDTYIMVRDHFRRGEYATGLVNAIQQVGEKLKYYFPYQSDDENELSDEISKGNI